jgi:periplasmic protein TonB
MFYTLVESQRRHEPTRLVGGSVVSLVAHAAVIGGAVIATLNVGQSSTAVRADTAMVYLAQQQEPQKPPEAQPVQLAAALQGFQTVVAPTEIPSSIPPVNLEERFNPRDYTGTGVEGGVAKGVVPVAGQVYLEAIVEEKPSVLSAPHPIYPELLRQAGIQGRVVLRAIIDTTGRAEPVSIIIMQSPNPEFDRPSRDWLAHALFRPARVRGRAVRVLVEVPLDYRITGPVGG